MISCYEGLPGAGKTYDAMRKLLDNLSQGRRILTNISGPDQEEKQEIIKHFLNLDDSQLKNNLVVLQDHQVIEFWDYTNPGDLIIIDEVQNFFNSRDFQSKANRAFGKWASEHRHMGVDLILITQNVERIESSVRSLIEFTYRYKKLNMFGNLVKKKYIRFCYYGPTLDQIGQKTCSYDPKIFKCYKSFFKDGTKEIGIESPVNILKHPIFYVIPCCLVVFIYFLSQSSLLSGDLFGTKASAEVLERKKQESLTTQAEGRQPGIPAHQPENFRHDEPVQADPLADYLLVGIINSKRILKSKINGSILVIQ
ncbi:zonular occludens toxin domain-containing protein [Desulfobacter vibrioformis]|uniref:zonular occludens toxin domain-containing protein n=1 Tax=Desulfobacter vibrioformis TaxID=34031 RepID=UPI000558DD7E|nr:zonular occludens toxin domain-containing protein [Desulfobacter vibrioformis]